MPPVDSVPVPGPPVRHDWSGMILVAMPAAVGLIRLLTPWAHLTTLLSATVVACTAVLVWRDAKRFGQPASEHVASVVVLWLVFFPIYLHRRARWGAPRWLWPGLGAVALFLAGMIWPAAPWGGPRVEVRVVCGPAGSVLGDGLACTAEPTRGPWGATAVCWRTVLHCSDGVRGEVPRTCATVRPPSEEARAIPFSDMEGVEGCRNLERLEVVDLTVVTTFP